MALSVVPTISRTAMLPLGALSALVALSAVVGCAASSGPVGGWGVILRVSDPERQIYHRYDLAPSGRLSYADGPGMLASSDTPTPTWQHTLTPDEAAPLRAFLSTTPAPTPVTPDAHATNYKLQLAAPGASAPSRYVSGSTPYFVELERLLHELRQRPKAHAPIAP
jgi:hypothetical protein